MRARCPGSSAIAAGIVAARFSGMWRPAKTTVGGCGGGSRLRDVRRIAAPQPAQAHDLAAQPLVAQPALVQRAEDEGARRQQDAQPLHRVADAPARAPRYSSQ